MSEKKKNMPNYPTITTLNLLKGAKCCMFYHDG